MTAAAMSPREPVPPPADPVAIRACLTPLVAAEFDREWGFVLDEARRAKNLEPVTEFLQRWRHVAYAELKEPGSYFRLMAKASQRLANPTATPTGSASADTVKALIRKRLGE